MFPTILRLSDISDVLR